MVEQYFNAHYVYEFKAAFVLEHGRHRQSRRARSFSRRALPLFLAFLVIARVFLLETGGNRSCHALGPLPLQPVGLDQLTDRRQNDSRSGGVAVVSGGWWRRGGRIGRRVVHDLRTSGGRVFDSSGTRGGQMAR